MSRLTKTNMQVPGTGPSDALDVTSTASTIDRPSRRLRRSCDRRRLISVTMACAASAIAFALVGGTAGAAGAAGSAGVAGPSGLRHRSPVTTVPPASGNAPGTPVTPTTTPVATAGGAQSSIPTGATPGSGAPATCSASNLSLVQSYVEQALSNRVVQLNLLIGVVGGATRLTAGDHQTLSSDLSNELSGIQALQQKVPSDTTCLQVVQDARSMVRNFRVYLVMTPQVRLTVSADSESAVAGQLAGLEPQIQAAIAAAQKNGKDVAGAQQAFTDLQTQVANAQSASANVSGPVLAFTPGSYPGCRSTFASDIQSLQGGRADLGKADTDLHTIVSDLT